MSRPVRGMRGVVNTIAGMLELFDEWTRAAAMPDEEGKIAIDYSVSFVYIGPDGIQRGTTRDEMTASGPDGHGPPPGRYEIHIVDSNGNDLMDPFCAENITYEMMQRRRPEDSFGAAMGAALGDLETQIRNQRARIDAAERREEKYRLERNTALDNNAKLLLERGMLELRMKKAEGDAEAAREELKLAQEELAHIREETAMFKPHAAMIVDEGMHWLAQRLNFPLLQSPSANDGQMPQEGGAAPMPQGIGAEEPLALFQKFFAATLANPYVCRWFIEASIKGDISPAITWSDIRALFWANTKFDLGATPDWDQLFADYDAERAPAAAE